ncbi:MAG: ATP-grasp domain-containing protein, partial [Gammaproteobacteria bacterium]
ALASLLVAWPRPVVNAPRNIRNTERRLASELLQDVPGLLMPLTQAVSRDSLKAIVHGEVHLCDVFASCDFPIILRPVGSHAGRDLVRIDTTQEISGYLSKVHAPAFFLSRFIDYRGKDGLFRKFRIALIAGRPYACHMAISSHWMIHYVNAGMYEDAAKRAEEASFMLHFDEFVARHCGALNAVHRRSGLDYVCIDCAETPDGELLIFEIDHAMVVHAMDPGSIFPYKQTHMLQVKTAFEQFLFGLNVDATPPVRID